MSHAWAQACSAALGSRLLEQGMENPLKSRQFEKVEFTDPIAARQEPTLALPVQVIAR